MELASLKLVETSDGVRFEVRAKPRAYKSRLMGVVDGELQVALTVAPVDGKANKALMHLLAGALGVGKRDISLLRGATGRLKLVEVRGLSAAVLRERLAQDKAQRT
ncbi:MAG: DUF167 domain-containing protein [Myxococcales bacterium]